MDEWTDRWITGWMEGWTDWDPSTAVVHGGLGFESSETCLSWWNILNQYTHSLARQMSSYAMDVT